ncbi:MAG: SDR family NAD(P)-dependent oxidoreductase [Myxococcales bacterium]|nr:MAG: SDR family NAD(P)-dependent oxidoreductase [Myxococcales bacterium]
MPNLSHRSSTLPYRKALITGASSGIGKALALDLARSGIFVVLAARNLQALQQLQKQIHEEGGQAKVLTLDVSKAEQVAKILQQVDEELGGIDLLIANAGISERCSPAQLQWDKVSATIDVNVRGATASIVALLPRMTARKQGHIVGISSLAQYKGLPLAASYSASKAFLSRFLESLRVDLRGSSVFITEVRPGFIQTPMTEGNTFKMPFVMDAGQASRIIIKGIASKKALVAFPTPMVWAMRLLTILPLSWYDRFIKKRRSD